MKHVVDIETWERRDNYSFFRTFLSSWYSVTTEIDCTEAYAAAKASGRSFFLYYLYAVLRAANEVREFRYRTDSEGNVAWYDTVDIITPIAVPGRTFCSVRIPYCEDFNQFYEQARKIATEIPADGDPYRVEKELRVQGDFDVIHLSANPDFSFTAVTYAQAAPGCPSEYPILTAGKAVMREGRLKMPYGIYINHAFVDGAHLSLFFKKAEEYLRKISE